MWSATKSDICCVVQVDADLQSQLAALKEKSQMEIDAAVKAADAATLEMIESMPEWVDSEKLLETVCSWLSCCQDMYRGSETHDLA